MSLVLSNLKDFLNVFYNLKSIKTLPIYVTGGIESVHLRVKRSFNTAFHYVGIADDRIRAMRYTCAV